MTMTVNRLAPHVFTVDDVYSLAECRAEIAFSETRGYEAAPIAKAIMAPEVRNNTRVMVDDAARAGALAARVRSHLPPEIAPGWRYAGLNERLRYYRYEPGERFEWHTDGVYVRDDDERSWLTLMVYLNDDFAGGGTSFLLASGPTDGLLTVRPRAGMALAFDHGHDERLHHRGDEVQAGRKYVVRTDVMYRRAR